MIRRGPAAALFLLVLALASHPSWAWVELGFWWWDRVVWMKTGGLGQDQLDGTSYQDLAYASIQNWYSYCDPAPSLTWLLSTDDCSPEQRDGINCTGWANLGQCEPGSSRVFGQMLWRTAAGEPTHLIEADVLMNSSCSVSGYWTSTRFLSTLTHEMGHVLGLAHSSALPALMNTDRDRDQVWHPETDDCSGARSIYSPPVLPTVTTYAASFVGQTSATLNGEVNPNGTNTAGWFNICCFAGGGGMTLTAQGLGAGKSTVPLTFRLDHYLSCDTTYHFHAAAANGVGNAFGENQSFTTLPCSTPTASSSPATAVTRDSATLNGTVNPNGADTSVYFQWGPTPAYGYDTAAQAIGSGQDSVALSLGLSDLACGTSYHFRIVAVNSAGSSFGSDRLLTTGSCVDTGSPIGGLYTLPPCRAFDSRAEAPLSSGLAAVIPLAGASPCPIPTSAVAVAANITVVAPSSPGYLVLWPAGQTLPPTSTINFSRNQVRANNAILPVGADGRIGILATLAGGGSVHCIVDVTGYFEEHMPDE